MRAASRCVADYYTCAVLDDKSVKCFGKNNYGQLGVGDTTDRHTPTAVTALGTSVVQIALGGAHARAGCRACRVLCEPLCSQRLPALRSISALAPSALALSALVRGRAARSCGD